MARKPLARRVVLWTVTIEAHQIKGPYVTYEIPQSECCLGGSERYAKMSALRWAHIDAKVPAWKPYLRQSWPHVRARELVEEVGL